MICIFKCPGCDSNMTFNVQKQKLECATCGNEIAVDEYDAGEITLDGGEKCSSETSSYICPTCGAEMLTDSTQATCTCNYCGTGMAVFGSGEGKVSPEKIIPFSVHKDQAEMHFKQWWMEHDTMPDFDMKKMKLEIHPMYLPVWLVNANVQTNMSLLVKRTEVADDPLANSPGILRSQGPLQRVNDKMMVTRRYAIFKSVASRFDYVPSNASFHFSSTRFQGIEPYDYDDLEDFTPAYLSGFPAEQYSVKIGDIIPRTIKRIREFGAEQCKKYIMASGAGVSEMEAEMANVGTVEIQEACYALVPVWLCTYFYSQKRHTVYVNGQTGKTDGEILIGDDKAYMKFATTSLVNFWFFFGCMLMVFPYIANFFTIPGGKYAAMFIVYMVVMLIGMPVGSYFYQKNHVSSSPAAQMAKQKSWDSDIEYVKKNAKGRDPKTRLKLIVGTLTFLFGLMMYDAFARLLNVKLSSMMAEITLMSAVTSVLVAVMTLAQEKKEEKGYNIDEDSEYKDYLKVSETEILQSTERIL